MEDYAFGRINGIWRLWDVKYNTRTMAGCAQSHFSHQICAALRAKVLRTFWQLWQLQLWQLQLWQSQLSIKKVFWWGCILIPTQDNATSTQTNLQALCLKNKTIGDEGITVDFRFIKVHTSNWSSNSWGSSNSRGSSNTWGSSNIWGSSNTWDHRIVWT